jgi:hypothetical protein
MEVKVEVFLRNYLKEKLINCVFIAVMEEVGNRRLANVIRWSNFIDLQISEHLKLACSYCRCCSAGSAASQHRCSRSLKSIFPEQTAVARTRVCDDEFPGSFFKNGKTKKVEVEKLVLKLVWKM